ncbi:MAG: hypothetical protein RLZZ440_1991 [Planctomycetota bacterium]|jgi:hypothetical protein
MVLEIASVVGWFVVMVVLMSIIEHQVHCRLMHKKPRFFLFKNLTARNRIFTSHAVEHHSQYRKHFHDDPLPPGEDRGIRLNVLEGLVESLPLTVPLFFYSMTGAIMFPVVVLIHHTIWNQIHLEMHQPKNRFFANWAAYKMVARHHYLHHRYPDKNFNVAFPIGDYLFNTVAKPSEADWEAMRAEGIAPASRRPRAETLQDRGRAA